MRDLRQYIDEYRREYSGKNKGVFLLSDYQQILELSREDSSGGLYFNLVVNALMAGFMVGYKKAIRDQHTRKTRGIEIIGVIDSDTGMITWDKE